MIPNEAACHIWRPRQPSRAGFVFLCPGRFEKNSGRPVSGDTGRNLHAALAHLAEWEADIFPSGSLDDYLITNAWPQIEFRAETGRPDCSWLELITKANVARLYNEIKDLEFVIACGQEGQVAVKLCVEFFGLSARVAYVSHTVRAALGCPTADEYPEVIKNWAANVAVQLTCEAPA